MTDEAKSNAEIAIVSGLPRSGTSLMMQMLAAGGCELIVDEVRRADVDNPRGEILPGAYTEVHLKIPSGAPALILPVSSLIFRSDGLQVGTVQNGNRAAITRITLGRDMGSEIEVVSGLTADDLVIANPPDSLISGETVRVVATGANADGGDASGSHE